MVHIDRLEANPWNPNRMDDITFQKELASLRKFGYVNPIIVRQLGERWQIIDGEHRKKALKRLDVEGEIPVTVIDKLDDSEAKQLTIVLNETRGKADPKRMGDLLLDLLGSESKSDLLDVLPYSPPVFDKLAGLAPLDWETVEQETVARPTGGWVERTYRLPREAAEIIDEALMKVRNQEVDIADWQALEFIAADFLGK
jgi:hypothetical protein